MGALAAIEMDAWLRQGGLVVTASERAARALTLAYHRARQVEGLTGWNAPRIQDWNSFVRAEWAARSVDGRLLLNATQEQALWAGIAAVDGPLATLLEGPRYRLAALAMEAHGLLASHAPRYLRAAARSGWQNDAAAFSRWLSKFDEACRAADLLSPAQLPLELLPLLESPANSGSGGERPALLLAGFDRILPVQRAIFDAWGACREAAAGARAELVQFHTCADEQAELAACARWCTEQLEADPQARLLVVTQDAAKRRGQMERAFLAQARQRVSPRFEFSLGVPLSQVALPRAAHLLLRWLSRPLAEFELDWLFSTGYAAAAAEESAVLQARMRALRRRGLERPQWTLDAFLDSFVGSPQSGSLPPAWVDRVRQARRRLEEESRRPQGPLHWAELVPQLLEALRFAAGAPLGSAEHQAMRRWQQALETAGSLGFDGRSMEWKDFLSALARTLEGTLFAPESRDAPIQIAGPAESAGLTADAVWFLGAREDAWPVGGASHPLLPPEVQREAQIPHASPQLDWDLAQSVTARLLASGAETHFSYAKQVEGVETRPSRLVAQLAGPPQPQEFAAPNPSSSLTVPVEDFSRIPYPPGKVSGGAAVLTAQSQCPFRAFATARMDAKGWEAAQAGLTPAQRGQLLHAVLHAVWAGGENGIRSHAELLARPDREVWVAGHVARAFESQLHPSLRDRMPARYLELEQVRLTRLVSAWLEFEAARVPFDVLETESKRPVSLAGLDFDLRLDRLDRLIDGSVLVIDYKSGDVTPKAWDLPRPEDVQLPLYAGFALDADQELGGLVFAKLRAGDLSFAGRVGNAVATLLPVLTPRSALVKEPFSAEMLLEWRDAIQQLAEDFLSGRAEVDPRDYPKACERCGLQSLCRIQENPARLAGEDEGEEAADE